MNAAATRISSALPERRGRTPRPSWSLAAGRRTPRNAAPIVFLFAVPAFLIETRLVHWIGMGHDLGVGLVLLAFPTWIAVRYAALVLRRRIAGFRALDPSTPAWQRDGAWPRGGVGRRIADGMNGVSDYVAWTVAGAVALCACCFALITSDTTSLYHRAFPEVLGWVPAHWSIAVATYVLPAAFLALVVGPRLLRGRLVVSWPTFPQFTGDRCAFELRTSSTRARIDGVRVFLRCIQKRRRSIPILPGWRDRLVWVAEARLPLNARVGPDDSQRAEFDVPSSAPSTDLHADDAVRWELLVLGRVGASDYADAVVVPVYAAR